MTLTSMSKNKHRRHWYNLDYSMYIYIYSVIISMALCISFPECVASICFSPIPSDVSETIGGRIGDLGFGVDMKWG